MMEERDKLINAGVRLERITESSFSNILSIKIKGDLKEDTTTHMKTLKSNLKNILEIDQQYPGSQYVQDKLQRIQTFAQENLSPELYREVYGSNN